MHNAIRRKRRGLAPRLKHFALLIRGGLAATGVGEVREHSGQAKIFIRANARRNLCRIRGQATPTSKTRVNF